MREDLHISAGELHGHLAFANGIELHELTEQGTDLEQVFLELTGEPDPTTDLETIHRARRFLQSLCYPRRGAEDVVGGGPPRALFVWPGVISLTCVLTALSFKYCSNDGLSDLSAAVDARA